MFKPCSNPYFSIAMQKLKRKYQKILGNLLIIIFILYYNTAGTQF